MATIDRQIATYESDGRFALPSDLAEKLGIEAGSKYEVTVQQQDIAPRPVTAEKPASGHFDESPIEELRAMRAGGPSLEDELLASRRSGKW